MSLLSWIYPNSPIDLGDRVQPIPANGMIPELPDWKVIETPGHSPGHVSLFRESDRVLIAGDAFVTVKQESAVAVITQKQKLHGPPSYFTCDWISAQLSVETLAALKPKIAATGHGVPMENKVLEEQLERLVKNFTKIAKPSSGRYVNEPALTNEQGVTYLPPAIVENKTIATIVIATVIGTLLFSFFKSNIDDYDG